MKVVYTPELAGHLNILHTKIKWYDKKYNRSDFKYESG